MITFSSIPAIMILVLVAMVFVLPFPFQLIYAGVLFAQLQTRDHLKIAEGRQKALDKSSGV